MLHPHTRKFLLLIFNCLRKVKTFKVKKSTEKNTITTPVNPPPTVLEKTETITMKRPRLSAHRGNCDPPLSYLCYSYPIIATNKTQGFTVRLTVPNGTSPSTQTQQCCFVLSLMFWMSVSARTYRPGSFFKS